jgi:D-beta-D-heptose 7-phosphate kinase/D-beta-D-heptose 1-phosphate adenosyltransferase
MYVINDTPPIFINGCFDVLHVGHIKFLQYCERVRKALESQLLIIALDSDEKIRKDKGNDRPIFSWSERRDAIWTLFEKKVPLSFVEFCTNEELEGIIERNAPILIKSERWRGNVVGEKYAKGILYFKDLHVPSTSDIIKKIREKDAEYLAQLHEAARLRE